MKRITRLEVSLIDYTNTLKGKIVYRMKWKRGSELIVNKYRQFVDICDTFGFPGVAEFPCEEFAEMIRLCKENGHTFIDFPLLKLSVMIRRWSYHTK